MKLALLHTADYHIGAYRWVPNYLVRTKAMLQNILDEIAKLEASTKILVIAGDFWDRTDLTEQERLLGSWFITSVLRTGSHIVQTLGNHEFVDEQGLTLIHAQAHWSTISPNYHVVAGDPQVVTIVSAGGPVQFLCLPCTQRRDTATFIRDVAALRAQAGPKVGLRYVIMHEAITAARDTRGAEIRLPASLVIQEDPDIDGYLLGDIHTRQSFGSRTWYCGSPIQVKRDESPDTGMLLWDGSVPSVVPLSDAPKFKVTKDSNDISEAVASESKDIIFYVGDTALSDVADLPKNIVLDPNYKAADVSAELSAIVTSECQVEAQEQLPAFLAALGHDAEEQLAGVQMVIEIADRLGL